AVLNHQSSIRRIRHVSCGGLERRPGMAGIRPRIGASSRLAQTGTRGSISLVLHYSDDGAYVLRRFEMFARVLGLTISALILAYGVVCATAQDRMTPQPVQQQTESQPQSQEGAGMMGHGGEMGSRMMGRGMMGGGMTGGRAMGSPMMLRMMFALMDTDGDGT